MSTRIYHPTEEIQGQLFSSGPIKFGFSTQQILAKSDLECGVFVTTEYREKVLYAEKPTSEGRKIFGATYYNNDRSLIWDNSLKCFKFIKDKQIRLIQNGNVIMYAESPVNAWGNVFYRYTADGYKNRLGSVNGYGGYGLELVPGAKFLEKTTSPGLVKVNLSNLG